MHAAARARRHLEVEEILAIVEGTCDDDDRRAALAHAAVCDSCRQALAGVARAVRSDGDDTGEVDESAPAEIDRFRIVRAIGRGAMGVVYEAFDPRLQRRVAIKRLHGHVAGRDAGTRLRREARTLARLNHPHVVAVLEAGPDWVAMEYVDGVSLHQWQRGRSWREILAAYLEAARGLAAAHEVGIVHRDFKPHNVLVGGDGRVRVVDFGLAASHDAAWLDTSALAMPGTTGLVGTPAYMAPEQFLGEPADARSDQFSYCVALFEALAGMRPFAGDDVASLAAAVVDGRQRARPRGSAVIPATIWRALDRGLQVDPARRWSGMDALARVLASGPRTRVRRAAALVAVGGVAIGVLALGDERSCRAADDIAEVWSADRARRMTHALVASGLEYGGATASGVTRQLEDHAARWTSAHDELCRAPLDMPAATECLEDRRLAVDELVALLETAERATVARAVHAIERLPDPRRCLDGGDAPPRSPEARELARTISTQRAILGVRLEDDDLPGLQRLLERADAIGDEVLSAEARDLVGSALAQRGRWSEGMPLLQDAYFRSYEIGDDPTAANAAHNAALGFQWEGHADQALEWARRARLSGLAPGFDRELAEHEAQLLAELGRPDEAELVLQGALVDREPSRGRVSALVTLGRIREQAGRFDEAEALLREAIAIVEEQAGPHHFDLSRPLNMLAIVQIQTGRYGPAIEALTRSREILVAELGERHLMAAYPLGNIAIAQSRLGDHEGSYATMLHLLELFAEAHGPNHPQVEATTTNLAGEALKLGRPADALRHAMRGVAIARETRVDDEQTILAVVLVARAQRELGELERSMATWDEVLALRHEITPDDHDAIGWAEVEAGITARRANRMDVAREHLVRALMHYARSGADDTRPRERARAELEAATLEHDAVRVTGHLRRAWAHLHGVHEVGDAARRLEVISTWSDLGGPRVIAWSAIDQPVGTSR